MKTCQRGTAEFPPHPVLLFVRKAFRTEVPRHARLCVILCGGGQACMLRCKCLHIGVI